jgi:hypothetical protein
VKSARRQSSGYLDQRYLATYTLPNFSSDKLYPRAIVRIIRLRSANSDGFWNWRGAARRKPAVVYQTTVALEEALKNRTDRCLSAALFHWSDLAGSMRSYDRVLAPNAARPIKVPSVCNFPVHWARTASDQPDWSESPRRDHFLRETSIPSIEPVSEPETHPAQFLYR